MKNKIKLIATDMDGTLLNDELEISQANIDAINEFRARGGIFTLSTGRAPEGTKRYLKTLGLDNKSVKLICNIGCMIVDSATGESEVLKSVDNATAAELLRFADGKCKFAQMYAVDGLKVEKTTDLTQKYGNALGIKAAEVGNLADFAERCTSPIIKVLLIVDEREVNALMNTLAVEFPTLRFVQSTAPLLQALASENFYPTMIECLSDGADKGRALKRVADGYGIDMSEVMAFGDSFNDASMIKAAGVGVVMANGQPTLKKLADIIADTNNADGVAKIIRQYCLD